MILRLAIMLAGAAGAVWSFRRWRTAVQVAMIALVLEGAVRKWLLLEAQDLIYFVKDVILLAAYAGFVAERRRIHVPIPRAPMLYLTLAAGALFGALEVFNPQLPNFLVGLLGFKAYFWYLPLLFVVPAVFPSDGALARFLTRYLLLSVPVGLLAVAQFFSPATSPLNSYARASREASSAVTFGSSEFVRVTGTFSFISGYAAYLTAIVMLALAVLATTRWRFRRNLKVYLALAAAILGMLMTGSRGPILVVGALFPVYWLLTVGRERQSGRAFGQLLAGVALVGALVTLGGQDALEAFHGRAAGSGEDMLNRSLLPFTLPYSVLPDAGLLGYGIGATHQAATAVTHGIVPFSWLEGHFIEAASGRVMLELGPIGFLLVYMGRILLALFALRQVFRLRTPFHRSMAVACLLVFLAAIPGDTVFDVTAGLLFWFFGGLLMSVIHLDRQAAAIQQTPPAGARAVPRRVAPLAAPEAQPAT